MILIEHLLLHTVQVHIPTKITRKELPTQKMEVIIFLQWNKPMRKIAHH